MKMAQTKAKQQTTEEYMNEKIPYVLNKPDGVKDTSRTVTVNGVNYQIQYNKQVMIPRFIAEILEQSRAQELRAQELIEGAEMR